LVDNAVLLIELRGSAPAGDGLHVGAGTSTVRGLVINGFSRTAGNGQPITIDASGDGVVIEGNFIGTDASGSAAVSNEGHGVDVLSGNNHTVGGTTPAARNVISGNVFTGIRVNVLNGITIQGNFIGTQADGVSPLGNGGNGVGF